jgi:hypothetical protein
MERFGNNYGERLDTVEGYNDLYDNEDDDDDDDDNDDFAQMKDSDDDLPEGDDSEEEDLDAGLGIVGAAIDPKKKGSHNPEKIEVNFDELDDDDD